MLKTPDLTPAHIIGLVYAVIGLSAAFGIWTPTQAEQDSLDKALWAVVAIIFGDGAVRVGRAVGNAQK